MVLERAWLRWLVAALVFLAATGLNLQLQPLLEGRAPLLPYFPALVVVGLVSGYRPALALTVVSCLAVLYFWTDPVGQFWPITHGSDFVLMGLFILAGVVVATVSALAGELMQRERLGRRRLGMALAAGRMVSWDWDLKRGGGSVAGATHAVFGAPWRGLQDMLASVHPDDADGVRRACDEAIAAGGPLNFVCRMRRKDNGELVWARTDAFVATDARGRALRAAGVTVDITARQQVLLASQAAAERFHLALLSAKVMAWECNEEGRLVWSHNVPEGAWPHGVLGLSQPAFLEVVRQALATGDTQAFPTQVQRDGVAQHLLTSLKPAPSAAINAAGSAAGAALRVLGATVDVTELAGAQEKLREEGRRKDQFLATLAHELRNPMAAIRYAVALLGQPNAPQLRRERSVEIIGRQSAHMARLLDDLLDLSRITRDVIELQHAVIDLRTVATQALDAAGPLLHERQQQATLTTPAEGVFVNGDATRLQQVLGNLLDNAAKYSAGPGKVAVQVSVDGGLARVDVQDTGRGIAAAQQAGVFEMFTRVDGSAAVPAGLGIGLAVSRRLMALHGGGIAVSSDGPGQGSRFTVTLPLAERPPEAAAGAAEPGGGSLEGLCVLVVDDNVDAADALAAALRANGFDATVSYTGEAALAAYARTRPRVVLLDIGLPDISGLEVARRLRRLGSDGASPEPTLIAITGWGQPSDRDETTAAGFDAHLVKPVEYAELEGVVRRLVNAAANPANPAHEASR